MSAPRALRVGHDLARGVEQVRLAPATCRRRGPVAAMKVLAMPPPTISWSTLPTRLPQQFQLGRLTLRAGDDRQQRPRRMRPAPWPARRVRPSAAGRRRRPGAKRITPWVEACARCAVPNASITNTSHSAAYCSTAPRRPASRRRSCGSSPAAPAGPARRRRHRPSRAPAARRRPAVPTAARPPAPANRPSLHTPSFGRPRCDVTITAAPFSSASRRVGSAASDALLGGDAAVLSIGTLRSSRISTRLPARSRSVMRRMDMVGCSRGELRLLSGPHAGAANRRAGVPHAPHQRHALRRSRRRARPP